jgi:hypothetical protein
MHSSSSNGSSSNSSGSSSNSSGSSSNSSCGGRIHVASTKADHTTHWQCALTAAVYVR